MGGHPEEAGFSVDAGTFARNREHAFGIAIHHLCAQREPLRARWNQIRPFVMPRVIPAQRQLR